MNPALVLGRIVWANIADANGIHKLRPAVITTPSEQVVTGQPIDVVAVTSRLPKHLPQDQVLLPWHRAGHVRTGLNRRCAALCSWNTQIMESDIQDVGGLVPNSVMAAILAGIAAASGLATKPAKPTESKA